MAKKATTKKRSTTAKRSAKRAPAKRTVKRKSKSAPAKRKTAPKRKAKASSPKKGKHVYFFGPGKSDGNGTQKPLLGGKGANLAEMSNIGLPVPAGFTITTEVCTYYYKHGRKYPTTRE